MIERCLALEAENERLRAEYAELRDAVWGEPSPDAMHKPTCGIAVDHRVAYDCIDELKSDVARLQAELERVTNQRDYWERVWHPKGAGFVPTMMEAKKDD